MRNIRKNLITLNFVFIVIILFFLPNDSFAKDLQSSLGFLPNILESPDKGVFVDLIKAIDEVYTEGKIEINVYPFARSVMNIVNGIADFQMPMMGNPVIPIEKLPYRYASEKMGKVVFVIYSHRDSPISKEMIEKAQKNVKFPYIIETGRGADIYFDFPVQPSNGSDQSLKKVNKKRIDAYIMGQEEADFMLKNLLLKTIHRSFYYAFNDMITIPKGKEGDEIDRIISNSIRKLKSTGRWQELYRKVHFPYNDWQIYNQ